MGFIIKHFRISLILLGLIYSLSTASSATAQLSLQSQSPTLPEVKADFIEKLLVIDHTRSAMFHIAVHIPSDHHGYLDAGDDGLLIPLTFTFPTLEKLSVRVEEISRPLGKRDDSAHATVLRGRGEFAFQLDATNASLSYDTIFTGDLLYQICNDITNICYAPRTIKVPLNIDLSSVPGTTTRPAAADQGAPEAPLASLTVGERVTAMFRQSMNSPLLALGIVFIAGLLASATPCVYPIIPITSAILMARGQGSRQRGRLHAVIYFLGIILFYTTLGLMAVFTGTALSAAMANAWVNLAFAILFAYFGLSMLGLYEFHFMSSFIARLDNASGRRNGLTGTFLMGLTAGLVVSPCVGPVAGTILLQITGQTADTALASAAGNAVAQGIALMTSFGAGLGLPFLIIGLISHRLPQSGGWLPRVKFLLGIPILYFAYTYYLKGTETANVPHDIAHAILIGIIAIAIGVFVGAFHQIGSNPTPGLLLRRALGIVLLIVGTHFLYNGMRHSGILLSDPLTISATATQERQSASLQKNNPPRLETHGNLQWLRDFSLAQQRASAEHKPLFIDFYATWCANCKAFQRLTVVNSELNQALQQVILVKIYDTDETFKTFQQNRSYPELRGVGGQPFLPLFAIYSPGGALTWKGQDYKAVDTMIAQLQYVRRITAQ